MINYSFLDLIKPKAYHSCVITTYSFDFYYFEYSLLTKLRSLGIQNIHILVDESMLDSALGQISGETLSHKRSYSISSIRMSGAFHPKIFLFFGDKEGFLSIGSGNLTTSGMGHNLELWGAFHISDNNPNTKHLFFQVWNYVKSFLTDSDGIIKEKISWIGKYSTWISEAEQYDLNVTELTDFDDGYQGTLLVADDVSIFAKILKTIPGDINKITMISPFLDSDCEAIKVLAENYEKAELIYIGQKEYSQYPHLLSSDLYKRMKLYDWQNQDGNLHAKMILFESTDRQFITFGSANISKAAMGTNTIKGKNAEASILISHPTKNWLEELGLKKNLIEIQPDQILKKKEFTYDDPSFKKTIRLKFLDLNGNNLRIGIEYKAKLADEIYLKLFNSWGEESFVKLLVFSEKELTKNLLLSRNIINNAAYGQLFSVEGKAVSNKQIVNNIAVLLKTYPSGTAREIEIFLSQFEEGNKHLLDVFQFLSSNRNIEAPVRNTKVCKETKRSNDESTQEDKEYYEPLPIYNSSSQNFSMNYKHSMISVLCDALLNFKKVFSVNYHDDEKAASEEDLVASEEELAGNSDIDGYQESIPKATNSKTRSVITFYNSYIRDYKKLKRSQRNVKSLDEIGYYNVSMYLLFATTELKVEVQLNKKESENRALIPLRKNEDFGSLLYQDDFYGICLRLIFYFTISIKELISSVSDYLTDYLTLQKKHMFSFSMLGISLLRNLLSKDKVDIDNREIERISDSLFYIVYYKMYDAELISEKELLDIAKETLNNVVNFSRFIDVDEIIDCIISHYRNFSDFTKKSNKFNNSCMHIKTYTER